MSSSRGHFIGQLVDELAGIAHQVEVRREITGGLLQGFSSLCDR